ncbi:MAG: hypothetical protein K0U45_05640 [Alphaproteobacteria bacterium]|nr:hypothetical protein [Alphaproteobacteria bacterium]
MLATIIRAPSANNPTMQLQAQQVIYDNVKLLRINGLCNMPINGQKAWLLLPYPQQDGVIYALPIDYLTDNDEEGSYQLSAPSGASIILQKDGSILLKPKQGQKILAENPEGKKKSILLDGDFITITGASSPIANLPITKAP